MTQRILHPTVLAMSNLRDNLKLLDLIEDTREPDLIDRMWMGTVREEDLADEDA